MTFQERTSVLVLMKTRFSCCLETVLKRRSPKLPKKKSRKTSWASCPVYEGWTDESLRTSHRWRSDDADEQTLYLSCSERIGRADSGRDALRCSFRKRIAKDTRIRAWRLKSKAGWGFWNQKNSFLDGLCAGFKRRSPAACGLDGKLHVFVQNFMSSDDAAERYACRLWKEHSFAGWKRRTGNQEVIWSKQPFDFWRQDGRKNQAENLWTAQKRQSWNRLPRKWQGTSQRNWIYQVKNYCGKHLCIFKRPKKDCNQKETDAWKALGSWKWSGWKNQISKTKQLYVKWRQTSRKLRLAEPWFKRDLSKSFRKRNNRIIFAKEADGRTKRLRYKDKSGNWARRKRCFPASGRDGKRKDGGLSSNDSPRSQAFKKGFDACSGNFADAADGPTRQRTFWTKSGNASQCAFRWWTFWRMAQNRTRWSASSCRRTLCCFCAAWPDWHNYYGWRAWNQL